MIRLDFEQPLPGLDVSPWLRPGALQEFKAVVISDYGKGTLAEAASLLEAVGKSSIPLLVDPKDGDYAQWRGATLLTPNISEFEAVVGRCADESILQRKGQAMITELDLQALLVTRGERGMTLLRPGLDMLHLPARTQDVYDVTGAGDTVIAVLASALGAGNTIEQAVALANLAAGLAVGHPGTAVINGPELVDAVHAERGVECGVLGLEQLQTAVDSARKQGQRIVFTNGCFDILHAGHVACLEQARQRGDRLIVAVNSDASVLRLKGSGRPLNTLSRRMAVLAALEAVDWVISFDTDTPEELLVSLRPDLLVKGGDYRLEQVVGRKIVEAYGGEVEVLDLLPGFSTSALVDEPDA
jgi:D-beta-D-heptose 7-phosphate kinase/D-beta-D-heptose 1-phosphate adenosyltransferase